jgi:hypothetical protein
MVQHCRGGEAHTARFEIGASGVDPCGQAVGVCYQPGDEHGQFL